MDVYDKYAVVTHARAHGGRWLVVRKADRRLMTAGDVITCLRWVNVWGPVDQVEPKRGTTISDSIVI